MKRERALAERLARMTEKNIAGGAQVDTDEAAPGGLSALERVIRAYSGLHHTPAPEKPRAVQFGWGHLDVLEPLGSGSYGEVFRAFDKVLECEVALKLRSSDETSARAYIVEARRLAQVRHVHVLAVHGAAVHDGRAGLWSDLIEGQTLTEWVETDGPRPRHEVLAAATMLAAALEAVHRAGLIHGDIKPSNIMHDADGKLVLMDFGTAVESRSDGVRSFIGSPLAMAPEQLDGSRITAAVDVYALGVVLYFLACGRYPIQAASMAELSSAHASGTRPDFTDLHRHCGRTLANLVERMMAPTPEQRPGASALVMTISDIERAPARRRKRIAVASVVVALIIALGASLIALVRIDAERAATAVANAREASVRGFMREFLASPKPSAGGADARVIDVLMDAVPVAERRFASEPLALAEVLGDIGVSLSSVGAHTQAKPLLERALKLGHEHGMTRAQSLPMEIRLAAGTASVEGGMADTAPLQALFDTSKAILGASDSTTLQAALSLATVQIKRADLDASELTFRYVINQLSGPRDSVNNQRLTAQAKLATNYAEQQRWQEAEAILREALAAVRAAGVENTTGAISLRFTEANLAARRSRFAEAEVLVKALLIDIEKTYGVRHPDMPMTFNELGINQRLQGKTAEAIASFRNALDLVSMYQGSDHPDLMTIRSNLAAAYADSGDREASIRINEEVYSSALKSRGGKDPQTLIAGSNLAEQYVENGDGQRGYDLAVVVAKNAAEVFDAEHLIALEPREVAARGLLELGRVDAALAELRILHEAKRRTLGEYDVFTLRSAGYLASALAAKGDRAATKALLEPAIASLHERFGDDQPDLQRMRKQVVALDASKSGRKK